MSPDHITEYMKQVLRKFCIEDSFLSIIYMCTTTFFRDPGLSSSGDTYFSHQ